jgi:hypothetical protein
MRSAHDANRASCVTTTPATPARQARPSNRSTDSPFTQSSAPVGSSASSNRRCPTMGPRDRGALSCTAGQLVREPVSQYGQTKPSNTVIAALRAAARA